MKNFFFLSSFLLLSCSASQPPDAHSASLVTSMPLDIFERINSYVVLENIRTDLVCKYWCHLHSQAWETTAMLWLDAKFDGLVKETINCKLYKLDYKLIKVSEAVNKMWKYVTRYQPADDMIKRYAQIFAEKLLSINECFYWNMVRHNAAIPLAIKMAMISKQGARSLKSIVTELCFPLFPPMYREGAPAAGPDQRQFIRAICEFGKIMLTELAEAERTDDWMALSVAANPFK